MTLDAVTQAIRQQFTEESVDITNPKQIDMLRQKYGLRAPIITKEERFWIRYFDEENYAS